MVAGLVSTSLIENEKGWEVEGKKALSRQNLQELKPKNNPNETFILQFAAYLTANLSMAGRSIMMRNVVRTLLLQ